MKYVSSKNFFFSELIKEVLFMAKYCEHCGSAMENDRPFCPNCGKASNYTSPQSFSSDPKPEMPMTIGDWIITLLISYIPVVGFIMTIVWALTASNTSKKNYARVNLLFMLVGFIFVFLCMGCVSAMIFEHAYYY